MARGHAEHLIGQLNRLLQRQKGAKPAWPDRLAVGIGPGSFTGVRVGLAAMRALALAWNLPLCGIGSLAAMAARQARTRRARAPFLVLLDAGRGHCYVQAFAPDAAALSAPERLEKAGVTRLAARHGAGGALGDGAARFAPALPRRAAPPPSAADIAMLAAAAPTCRAPAEPLYLQPYRVQAQLPLHAPATLARSKMAPSKM